MTTEMPFTVIVFLKMMQLVRNIVNRLYSFQSFQATSLVIEVNSQVVFTQGRFVNAKPIQ